MRKHVRWSAQELLTRRGFEGGQFFNDYHKHAGALVWPPECCRGDQSTLGQASHLPGEAFSDFVLCLVELLSSQGLHYIVLKDPDSGSDNPDTIDSFVYHERLYIPDTGNTQKWFATLPPELQHIFVNTTVEVALDEKEDSAPPSMEFLS
jgi:hypothetical protein